MCFHVCMRGQGPAFPPRSSPLLGPIGTVASLVRTLAEQTLLATNLNEEESTKRGAAVARETQSFQEGICTFPATGGQVGGIGPNKTQWS